ncbi:MAG: DUF2961 domain-containing protein [Gemmatimonadota bacterium]|nr:MAG: DUF2961 domain-containing protein [Gemmatimonadota bacterium]
MRNLAAIVVGLTALACNSDREQHGPFDYLHSSPAGRFLQVSSYDTTGGNRDRLEIAAGATATLLDVEGPGIIQRIWITVSSSDPHYLRRIALEMYWDGESEPSVSVPLGDFFGNGFDKRHYASLPMGVSSGGFYCYIPMPFARRARVVVVNGTGREIDAFYYHIGLVQVDDLPGDVPTFHAKWNRDIRTDTNEPHEVIATVGSGRFIGMSLNAESYRDNLEFLEGDELFYVDGEFRGQGTGTEDYFNGGWYFQHGEFEAPFHGVVIKDDHRGRIAAYRWHVLDPIPFCDSIRIELEHGHANAEVADYATVSYWYQTEPHEAFPPLPAPHERRVLGVKITPGALLVGDLSVLGADDRTRTLVAPVPRPDRYDVLVYPLGGPDLRSAFYGVAGMPRELVDLNATDSLTVLEPVPLGIVAAEETLAVELSPAAAPLPAALEIRPVRDWAVEWNVVGPFPNPRTLGTELSAAIDSAYGPETDPALGAAYSTPWGGWVRWKRATASPDGQVRLNPHFTPNEWVAAYAQAFLYSPADQDAALLFGADDAHVLWVNGERVSERQGRHISRTDELEVTVGLKAGWNRILLKVADLDGGWAFQMRVADPDGRYRWSARP